MNTRIIIILICSLSFTAISNAQFSVQKYGFWAKEFSKDQALYKSKTYVIDEILGNSKGDIVKFEIYPLAAASSGELTSLVYRCDDLNKEGIVLGFYGDRWNDAGVVFQSYSFKDIPAKKAMDMLNKLDSITDVYIKYLNKDAINNNIYYRYDDMVFLIYNAGIKGLLIRVQWNGFDSEWEWNAVAKTKKRLLKKLD